ncbi:hypothetical protein [Gordonia jinghuaiqii]|uniref:hypothetical protein n=1 Tax=Gordonia jinghuaiqii TaxID=2758710 RepID=UPI0035679647
MTNEHAATDAGLPFAQRKIEDMPGPRLPARLGKRVLRLGGRELTERLLDDAAKYESHLAAIEVIATTPSEAA